MDRNPIFVVVVLGPTMERQPLLFVTTTTTTTTYFNDVKVYVDKIKFVIIGFCLVLDKI